MKNIKMIQQIYTDLVETLCDISGDVVNAKTYEETDEILTTADKISVILKRLGETAIIEIDDKLIEDNNKEQPLDKNNTKEGDE